MFFKKKGFPEEGEIVLCTVMKVESHSIFVTLDEYDRNGLIHISEVSPGRIRNIRDFVREGKKIVCLVLNIDESRGHIDLSLRRVNLAQKKEKISQIKQEQTAEKIIEIVAEKLKADPLKMYKDISQKALKKFNSIFAYFQGVVNKETSLKDIGLEESISNELNDTINQRIKPVEIKSKAQLSLKSFAPDGISIIKQAISKAMEAGSEVKIVYLGSGKYDVTVCANNYKKANIMLDDVLNRAVNFMKANNGEASFEK